MSFVEKTGWFLANAASSIAIMISLFFWLFLYQVTLTLDPVDIICENITLLLSMRRETPMAIPLYMELIQSG